MDKRGVILVIASILIGIVYVVSVVAVEEPTNDTPTAPVDGPEGPTPQGYETEIPLVTGKNYVEVDQLVFVRDLVNVNPHIQTVSYYDPIAQTTIGYVDVFGGIGKNFIMDPGTGYEISVAHDMTLVMPY